MIKLSQAVIVEGKYDKIKLSGIIDALIIEINGFQIFKDKEKAELIKNLAKTRGIIIMTDSDSAGLLLRNRIKEIAKDGEVFNAYIPEILGKEKRKTQASKEGLIGVEGVEKDIILNALEKCGIHKNINAISNNDITHTTLYNLGITGQSYSKQLRIALLRFMNLPTGLSKNNMLKILQHSISKNELINIVNNIKEGMTNGRQSQTKD